MLLKKDKISLVLLGSSIILILSMCTGINNYTNERRSMRNYISCKKYINDNFHSYKHIREMMIDSFELYTERNQNPSIHPRDSFVIDSFILFNKNRDRLTTTLAVQRSSIASSQIDLVMKAQGVKIDTNWYFNRTINMPVRRAVISNHSYRPLSFDVLSFIGRTAMMHGFYKSDKDYNLIIDKDKLEKTLKGRLYKNGNWDFTYEEFKESTLERHKKRINHVLDSTEIASRYSPDTTTVPKELPMTEYRREKIDRNQRIFKSLGIKVH